MIIRARLEFVDFGVLEASAKFLGLPVHVHNELRTIDALRKPGKILNLSSCRELAAWFPTLQDERGKICSGGVDRGGQAGATRANDDDVFDGAVTIH